VVEGLVERQKAGLAIWLILIRNRAEIVEQAGVGLFPYVRATFLKRRAEMFAHQRVAVHRFRVGPGDQFQFFETAERPMRLKE
jgi:hypothetical protein